MDWDALTPRRKDALDELRRQLAGVEVNDGLMVLDDRTLASVLCFCCSEAAPNKISSRFLRARAYVVKDARKLLLDCLEWRKTLLNVGMTELYREMDPFDVRPS
jgi:hypothetical protein